MRSRILVAAVVLVALSVCGCALFSGAKKSADKPEATAEKSATSAEESVVVATPAKAAEKPAEKPAAPVKVAEKPVAKPAAPAKAVEKPADKPAAPAKVAEKPVERPAEKVAKPAKPPKAPKPPKPAPTTATLSLTVNVKGAEVVIDDAVLGRANAAGKAQKFVVKAGTHSLVVKRFGYEDYKAQLGFEVGKVNTHKVELKRTPTIDVSKELQSEKAAAREELKGK